MPQGIHFSPTIFSIFTSILEDYMLLKYADNSEINGMINYVGHRPITHTGLCHLANLMHLKSMLVQSSCMYEQYLWAILERQKITICQAVTVNWIWTTRWPQPISTLLQLKSRMWFVAAQPLRLHLFPRKPLNFSDMASNL